MEEKMSAKEFDEALEDVWQQYLSTEEQSFENLQMRLTGLLEHSKEDLDDASYMRLMYMKGLYYEEQNNKNAARYCAMRMYEIQECLQNPRKKRPRLLDLRGYVCEDAMLAFIQRYTDFLQDTYAQIEYRLRLLAGILFLGAFVVGWLVIRLHPIVSFLQALFLAALIYGLQRYRIPAMFFKKQVEAIASYVEDELLEFDRPIRFL